MLLLAACGLAPDLGRISASRLAQANAIEAEAGVELLYWDNKNLGFGHVAVAIHYPDQSKSDLYISYAMGNDYEIDREKHGKDPIRVKLPGRKSEPLSHFEKWYRSSPYSDPMSPSYGADYSMLKHNCAHGALDVLRALGYNLAIRGAMPIALRPVQVYRAAKNLNESALKPAF